MKPNRVRRRPLLLCCILFHSCKNLLHRGHDGVVPFRQTGGDLIACRQEFPERIAEGLIVGIVCKMLRLIEESTGVVSGSTVILLRRFQIHESGCRTQLR